LQYAAPLAASAGNRTLRRDKDIGMRAWSNKEQESRGGSSSCRARTRHLGRLLRADGGTAVVEFAIVAIPLFLLVFGILEFSRALNYYNDLTQLAGQGARAAAVDRNPDGSAAGAATADCPAGTPTIQCQLAVTYPTTQELKSGISVCLGTLNTSTGLISSSVAAVGQPLTVRTKMNFKLITGGLFGFASITLSSTQSEIAEGTGTYTPGNYSPGGGDACSP
jgi:Flp pilus assembly protein TadG